MPDVLKTLVVLGARGDMTGRLLLPALVQLAGAGGLDAVSYTHLTLPTTPYV